jgi:hypothetical protein
MKILILLLGVLFASHAWSIHVSSGVYKSLIDVQDKNGKEVKNPFSPALTVGSNFKFADGFGFSPQLGFVYHTVETDDSYGKYKMYSIFLLYDFMWVPQDYQFFALRFGLGTFRKTISGQGGTVTIPNGNSTATAYRPESSTSYSSTINLGTDFNFNMSTQWFTNMGVRFEVFAFRPLSQEYRTYTYNLGLVAYF